MRRIIKNNMEINSLNNNSKLTTYQNVWACYSKKLHNRNRPAGHSQTVLPLPSRVTPLGSQHPSVTLCHWVFKLITQQSIKKMERAALVAMCYFGHFPDNGVQSTKSSLRSRSIHQMPEHCTALWNTMRKDFTTNSGIISTPTMLCSSSAGWMLLDR